MRGEMLSHSDSPWPCPPPSLSSPPKLPPATLSYLLTSSLLRPLLPPSVCTAMPCARLNIPEFVQGWLLWSRCWKYHCHLGAAFTASRPTASALLVTPAVFPHSLALSSHMFLFSWFCAPSPPDDELLEGRGLVGFPSTGTVSVFRAW